MSNHPDQPSGANEFAPLESTPRQSDPYAPVDYPMTNPEVPIAPPTVLGPTYPVPPGYPQATGYPPPPPVGYPAAPGYPAVGYPAAGYPPPPAATPYGAAYPYAADPYDPYRSTQPGTSGMAIGAMVASLVGLPLYIGCGIGVIGSIVGVVLGIVSLNQLKQSQQQGRGMAIAGIAVGGASLMLFAVLLIIAGASSH
jgi:Domain of unknown function (DUF4190)